ncbi:hypothetical protein MiSe_77120 [Microseira wollei NIES-4236]|uniref:Uncharacterized protein n=1 Tax=Microseira wollei NIES-4236 TaxID=2530354 RepID=A0AAV3WMV6_9CYAN|nr:hypothetical protein MiSe_77120 [Microseira wollei NIES-4236]
MAEYALEVLPERARPPQNNQTCTDVYSFYDTAATPYRVVIDVRNGGGLVFGC